MPDAQKNPSALPDIPVYRDMKTPLDLFLREQAMAQTLLQNAKGLYTNKVLNVFGRTSQNWLERTNAPFKNDVRIAAELGGHPGFYLLNLSYEWACTAGFNHNDRGPGVTLFRALDWPLKNMGDKIHIARFRESAGPYWLMTYPGYMGAIQGLAPGRFTAAINSAPIPARGLGLAGNWVKSRFEMAASNGLPPTFLLRKVFERCADFDSAVWALSRTELCTPAIFTLAGIHPGQHCIIERERTRAIIHRAAPCVGNHWLNNSWQASERPTHSRAREAHMRQNLHRFHGNFDWLEPPILNKDTRLVFEANARTGVLKAQGIEKLKPVTNLLFLRCD